MFEFNVKYQHQISTYQDGREGGRRKGVEENGCEMGEKGVGDERKGWEMGDNRVWDGIEGRGRWDKVGGRKEILRN